jgi:hypothetical protein
MLRAYTYRPNEVGLQRWPEGTLRLNAEPVDSPNKADVLIYPGALHGLKKRDLDRLPYLEGREERVIFFHCADHEELYSRNCLFIRCNTRTWYYPQDPNTISWPWPVENFSECVSPDFKYDVSFQGWMWSDARKQSVESCRQSGLNCDIATYSDFCGYIYNTPEGVRRRAEFRRSMRESRLMLCPESIPGVLPYRFFEAMSAGRIPVLVCSEYCLPFEDEIPYYRFTIRIDRAKASSVGAVMAEYLRNTSDDELIERGKEARQYWDTFLNRDKYVATMTYAVEKKLKSLGLYDGPAILSAA